MNDNKRSNALGVGISVLNLSLAEKYLCEATATSEFQGFVTITGVHGVVESQSDEELKRIHNRSFLSTPDGMPMVWLGRLRGFSQMSRVYGPELMLKMMSIAVRSAHKHYFFGGADGVAEKLKENLVARYEGVNVIGTMCPPFRPLTEEEETALYDELQAKKPHFFWVGLSTPKQEYFMHNFLQKHPDLTKGWDHGMVMLGVGAAFDFHSGQVKQAPYWIQRSGCEWLYRITQDPKRLLKRYTVSNSVFIYKLCLQIAGKKFPLIK